MKQHNSLKLLQLIFLVLTVMLSQQSNAGSDCVVLLHGLGRTHNSMDALQVVLEENDFQVVNEGYPSRSEKIELLASKAVLESTDLCQSDAPKIHFITHSLGGILVRYFLAENDLPRLGRVVMIAPPNQGSEVVDRLRKIPGYGLLNGPAGLQLGTDESSIPLSLGAVDFSLGVIAGNKTFNPFLSLGLPNPDDGKVSVESTKVEGMEDFIVVPHTHTFLMKAELVIEQALHFLKNGQFNHDAA